MQPALPEDQTMTAESSLGALASHFIDTESLAWIPTSPGSKMKVIYHDPATGMLTILAKLDPGAGIPPHVHEDLEQTFALVVEQRMHGRQFRHPRQGEPPRADRAQGLHHARVLSQAH